MIRFVATDLDGTLLLNGAQQPTARDFEVIRAMQARGVKVAAASGRQYPNLRRLFDPVWEDMIFICENGGLVVYRDQVLSQTPMPQQAALALAEEIIATEGCEALINTRHSAYIRPKAAEYATDLLKVWKITVSHYAADEPFCLPIYKVSIFQREGIQPAVVERFTERWGGQFRAAVSGPQWIDFTVATKGVAIRQLQQQLELSPDEMAAFGDNFNDVEMLDAVTYSFAMRGADAQVQAHARYLCDNVTDCWFHLVQNDMQPQGFVLRAI